MTDPSAQEEQYQNDPSIEAVTNRVPSADADSVNSTFEVSGTIEPSFH